MSTNDETQPGLLSRMLGGVVGFGARHPRVALWVMVLLGCAGVGVAVNDLRVRTSRADLIASSPDWETYQEAFGGDSEMVVVVQTDFANSKLLSSVLDELGQRLEREQELFANVFWKIDQTSLQQKGLQFLSEEQLKSTIRRVAGFDKILRDGEWDRVQLEQLSAQLESQVRASNERGQDDSAAAKYAENLGTSLQKFLVVDEERIRLNEEGFQSPWPPIVITELEHTAHVDRKSAGNRSVAYLMNQDRSVGMLHVQAVPDPTQRASSHAPAVERLREHLAEVTGEYSVVSPDLKLSVTGIPVLEHDELQQSFRDMLLASAVAFLLVGLLLSLGLKGMRHPMLVLIMLINALAITFGVATLVVGHLNILSICFAAIMIGLGVDFGIHFVTRYLHLRQELYDLPEALTLSGRSVGMGIFTSAATTALAFGSAALSNYPGLAELGIISAIGILICAFQTFTFLPALIAISDERVEIDELPVPIGGSMWRSAMASFPVIAIVVCVIGVGALAWQSVDYSNGDLAFKVKYDANLLKLQNSSSKSVQAERALNASDESLLYGVVLAGSIEETTQLKQQLEQLPTVARVTELASHVPETASQQKASLIQDLKQRLTVTNLRPPRFPTADAEEVEDALMDLATTLKKSKGLQAGRASEAITRFVTNLGDLRPEDRVAVLDAYQSLMVSSLLKEFSEAASATSLEPVQLAELPSAWRNRYLKADESGQLWLLKVYPKEDLWNHEALDSFVREVRTVSPTVTGAPVRHYEAATMTAGTYKIIALYSLAAISVFLLFDFLRPGQKLLTLLSPMVIVGFIGYTAVQRTGAFNPNMLVGIYLAMVAFVATVFDFRNLRDTLLALLPPILGGAMMLGLMALLQIDFNPLNLVVLPLVLGIGVDDGIHMIHDYRRQLASSSDSDYAPSGDTLNGVLFTSLTSIIGFGSLMVSGHEGLKSVGIVLALGVACCLAVAVLLLPPLLVLVARHQPASLAPVIVRKPKKKKAEGEAAAESSGSEGETEQPNRKLSRKERRRQAAA